tara:strand:- start:6728 stop:10159 length:3432 start_codon:yes stop_codon:yes gene_type:complete
MAILITPASIYRAATRFSVNEQAEAAGAPGEEAHIYNLYEEFSMPLSDIVEIGRLGLEGKLENVQEKMDGQFLAFTVVDGRLRFFTKMDLQGQAAKDKKLEAIRTGSKGGGMTLEEIMSTYTGGRSNIAEGFAIAYEALEPVALSYQDSLFRNGEVVIASQIMVSKNPNTILYDEDSLRTVLPIPLTDESVNQDALNAFKSEMKQASTEAFTMDEVPTARLIKGLEQDDAQIEQLEKDLESVVNEVGMSVSKNTVGDYIKARLEKFLAEKYDFIPTELVSDVADRFMTGKGKIALRLKKVVSPEDYQKFRALDKVKPRIVQEAIIPLENIIQRLGVMIIDKLDLALTASNQEELLGFIKDVRAAFESGFDFGLEAGDTKTLEGIRVALARLEANEDLFQRATEGIVFTYNGKTYKLTGLFTPINKMRGFFGSAMGREGFGKASLPDKGNKEELRESLKKIIIKMLSEGGNAFKKQDETGRKVVVTSEDRITREQANRIMADLEKNLLGPLGINFLPAGSTGTDKKEIGDIDLIVDEPDKEKLYQTMLKAPYLSEELVEGVSRVMKLGQLIAIMVQDPQTGQLFQVDLFPSSSIDDTAWELSGGGEGKVKGEYHKLMLSLLAKIKGERESSGDAVVKYTLSFPGGWRKKVNGKEDPEGRIVDPDNYLPLLGISAPKSEVRTFEELIKYMSRNNTDDFREALERFKDYIGNRLSAKSERTRSAAQKAIEAVESTNSQSVAENTLRLAVRKILQESENELSAEPDAGESLLDAQKSFAGKARIILNILQGSDLLNGDIEKVNTTSPSLNLMRFGLKAGSGDNHDFNDIVNKLYRQLLPGSTDSVVELAPHESPNPSGTYTAYMMPGLDNLLIIFGTAGTSGGQRKAGYIYEDEIGDQLQSAGMSVRAETDNAYSDVYVKSANGELGIEVKLPNAQAGEPTMRYDYDKGEFYASNPKPQNQDIANLVNMDPDMPKVKKRMLAIRNGINKQRVDTGEIAPIESVLGSITRDEYVSVVHKILNDTPTGLRLAAYTVSTDALRDYYMYKGAGVVQVKGKGLYHLNPAFEIDLGGGRKTVLFDFPPAQGAVYFRNNRGINYAMRTQFSAKPLTKLKQSGINLDNPSDREDFAKAVSEMNFPNAKSLVKDTK